MRSATRVPLGGLLGGVLATQVVNSAVHLAQPLLIAKLSGSLGTAAFFAAFGTGLHMVGTFLAGWPTERFGARRVLAAATLLRGVALAGIPIAMGLGVLTLTSAMSCYAAEALIRGFVDTSVHTVPLELAGHRRELLDRINSRYELFFEVGGVAGPLMLSGLMLWADGIVPHIVIPIGFALSAAVYLRIPRQLSGDTETTAPQSDSHGGSWAGLRFIVTQPVLLLVVVGLMSFHLYELRKDLSAFFAKGLMHHSASTGQIGAAFALGGVVGALLYTVTKHRGRGSGLVFGGAVGTVALAVGWIPLNVPVMVVAVFLFGVGNVCARLVLTRWMQELTPLEHAGGVTAAAEFGRTAASVGVSALVGVFFSTSSTTHDGFVLVSVMLAVFAVGQATLAGVLRRKPGPHPDTG
jgi:MFS family permease